MQLWMIINFSGHVHAMNLPQMGVDYCAALAACCTVQHAVKGYTMGEVPAVLVRWGGWEVMGP